MSKVVIDIDDDALAVAAAHYGTDSKDDTVNAALRDAAAQARRSAALDELVEIAKTGQFDILRDKRNRR